MEVEKRYVLNQLVEDSPNCEYVRKRWNSISELYLTIDSAPQTFFYTLSNMMKLDQSKNILEIACGAGKLIPQVLDLKAPETFYYATDISDQMIKFSKLRLEKHFEKYQSKITLDQWMKQQKLELAQANGQEKLQKNIKFDRIFCNMVLMWTKEPKKMLNNLWEHAEENCLLGLAVSGDKKKNLMGAVQDFSIEHNLLPPNTRSNFFLYDKIQALTAQCGWEPILTWEQSAMFPVIEHSNQNTALFIRNQVLTRFPQQYHQKFLQKIDDLVNVKKCGLQMNSKLMIVKKKARK